MEGECEYSSKFNDHELQTFVLKIPHCLGTGYRANIARFSYKLRLRARSASENVFIPPDEQALNKKMWSKSSFDSLTFSVYLLYPINARELDDEVFCQRYKNTLLLFFVTDTSLLRMG